MLTVLLLKFIRIFGIYYYYHHYYYSTTGKWDKDNAKLILLQNYLKMEPRGGTYRLAFIDFLE